jgi:hypothetical protein
MNVDSVNQNVGVVDDDQSVALDELLKTNEALCWHLAQADALVLRLGGDRVHHDCELGAPGYGALTFCYPFRRGHQERRVDGSAVRVRASDMLTILGR